jgi:hypothetical protein
MDRERLSQDFLLLRLDKHQFALNQQLNSQKLFKPSIKSSQALEASSQRLHSAIRLFRST